MGGIDEAALDRLSLVTEMSKHIAIKAENSEEENKKELGQFSPSFIWLLRDFYLDLEEDGQQVTARDYLEMALRNHVGSGPGVESKNMIRDSIRALFPERECVTLVRPCNDEKMLQKLNTVDMGDLRPEFTEGLEHLIGLINHRCQPKRVGNDVLNGPALAAIAQAYIVAINEGAVPEIQTAWQNVAEAECRRVMEDAEGIYVKEFSPLADPCPPEDAPLLAAHTNALKLAIAAFEAQAVGGQSIRSAHIAKLEESATRRYEEYKAARFADATAKANELVGTLMDQITLASEDTEVPLITTFASLDSGIERFISEAAGPEKTSLLAGLTRRALAGPVKTAHGTETTAAATKEAELIAEGEKAVAAVELQLEAAKTEAANEATEAAKRESDLKESSAEALAAAEKKATDAAQEAAKALAEAQEKAHSQQVADAEKLAASEKAANEKYGELERKAFEEQKEATESLAAAKSAAAEEATAAAKRESELKEKAADELASTVKEAGEKLAASEKASNEAEKEASKLLAEEKEKANEAQATAAAELAASEKKAMEAAQASHEKYLELEKASFEKEKEAGKALAEAQEKAHNQQVADAEKLAASEKAASEKYGECEKEARAREKELSEQLSATNTAASEAATESASQLAAAEKKSLEYQAAGARDVGVMDEKLRVAKEEMEKEIEQVKKAGVVEMEEAKSAMAEEMRVEKQVLQGEQEEAKVSLEERLKAMEAELKSKEEKLSLEKEAMEEEMTKAKAEAEASVQEALLEAEGVKDKLFTEKKSREKRENEFAHQLGAAHQELMDANEGLKMVMMKNEALYTENFAYKEEKEAASAKERVGFRATVAASFKNVSFTSLFAKEEGKAADGDEAQAGVSDTSAEPQLRAHDPQVREHPASIQAYLVRGPQSNEEPPLQPESQ